MKKPKILFLHHHKHVGGGQVYVDNLVKELKKKNYQTTLFQNPTLLETIKLIQKNKDLIIIWTVYGNFNIFKFLIPQLWHRKNLFLILNLWPADVSLPKNQKISIKSKTKYYYQKSFRWLKQLIMLKLTNAHIYLTKYERKVLLKFPLYKKVLKPSTFIYGAVDCSHFKSENENKKKTIKKKMGIPINNKILLAGGRISQRKNYEDVFKILSQLESEFPDLYLYLTLIGERKLIDESYLSYLFGKITQLKIGNRVRILTGIDHKEITKYYQIADIFITPSKKHETFGLVTLEAIASGCATFTYPACANTEIIKHGQKNFVAEHPQPQALTEKIENYLKLPEQQKKQLLKELQKNLKEFSWENSTDKVIKLIKK